ncbi:DEAD/DEAH box helicase [Gleimia coleocanis DSM 15436]|uniref:DEAD/DEAH box helicase n=1 Tax=Gleimia coleocanis DSM 15436 TaxID=525245 RepID=C0W1J4_9ACTO|nr:DEAD/DEAH box helicase [Gleimia coleocanis]EEH63360.1 DEAD/DEAH box helicase [Gleimia coleocanis DSM 15436]
MTRRRRHRGKNSESVFNPETDELSAAQRYRLAKQRAKYDKTERATFAAELDFFLDDFQMQGMESVENGHNVLVAAPTGAGKTMVGEFALHMALSCGQRAFYTTPIKALSNQKYRELCEKYGDEQVGLLTGDVAINGDAPLIVMTTEVARNMIYQGRDLTDLRAIVLDEVHYLADRFRGPVWEEVIIHAPQHVQIVALSATVSNAEEFGNWIDSVRSGCDIIVSEKRPVPLYQHMMVGRDIIDLYAEDETKFINPQLRTAISKQRGITSRNFRQNERHLAGGRRMRDTQKRPRKTTRPEVVISLDRARLLPAIYFIFSRSACEDAVEQIIGAGITLTSEKERKQIRKIVDEALYALQGEDLSVLRINTWQMALEAGVAAHHAGLLPFMKEVVEKLFTLGLVKVVFATETLALGINMPARTVVLEALRKWNGIAKVPLSAGEYTQLTGRAGRRGIDVEGHALVVWQDDHEPELVASLASKRTYPLVSAFRPTYNMVANLASTGDLASAREVMDECFAQFQADRKVVGLAVDAKRAQQQMDKLAPSVSCHLGDALEYFAAREELTFLQKQSSKRKSLQLGHEVEKLLRSLQPGDVISVAGRRRGGDGVVTKPARPGEKNPQLQVVFADGRMQMVSSAHFPHGFSIVGSMRLRKEYLRNVRRFQAEIGTEVGIQRSKGRLGKPRRLKSQARSDELLRITELEDLVRSHPVHGCVDRDQHARNAVQWMRARREFEKLASQVEEQTSSVAKRFDKIVLVLEQLGCLHASDLTDAGHTLRAIYGERDLVVALSLEAGIWDDLDEAQLASVVSACVFEPRKDHAPDPEIPEGAHGPVGQALNATARIMLDINRAESAHQATTSMPLETGLVNAMYWWVKGDSLASAVSSADLEAGDWVRWCKQTIDLLMQISVATRNSNLAWTARDAADAIRRSVVSLAESA